MAYRCYLYLVPDLETVGSRRSSLTHRAFTEEAPRSTFLLLLLAGNADIQNNSDIPPVPQGKPFTCHRLCGPI